MLNTVAEWCNDRISPEGHCPNPVCYANTIVSTCEKLMTVGGQSTSATSSAPYDVSGVVLYCNTRQRHRSRLPCRGHKHSVTTRPFSFRLWPNTRVSLIIHLLFTSILVPQRVEWYKITTGAWRWSIHDIHIN